MESTVFDLISLTKQRASRGLLFDVRRPFNFTYALILSGLICIPNVTAQSPLQLDSPSEYQVFQRSSLAEGTIRFEGRLSEAAQDTVIVEARITRGDRPDAWQELANLLAGQTDFDAKLTAPAGGWYRVDVRAMRQKTVVAESTVGHVGIGEIFVIAGQSNSANHGGERLQPQSGVVTSFGGKTWQIANDPQPGASGRGGSFIPPFGDAMAERFGVPIGIVSTGVGATSVREWLARGARFPNPPTLSGNVTELSNGEWESKGTVFESFVTRLKILGPNGFRAVLWHQGESDANQRDASRTLPGELYTTYLEQLIQGLAAGGRLEVSLVRRAGQLSHTG